MIPEAPSTGEVQHPEDIGNGPAVLDGDNAGDPITYGWLGMQIPSGQHG
jgi:hypothetical protein